MKKITLALVAAASLVSASSEYKYEVTPMFGAVSTHNNVDIKNHTVGGVSFGINLADDCKLDQLELGLLRTLSDADYEDDTNDTSILRVFANGVKEYKIDDTVSLYGLAGLGYEHINDNLYGNDSDPFFNYGVGAKIKVYEDMALKVDARHLLKFDGDQNIICTLGLAIPFGKKAQKIAPAPVVEETPYVDLDADKDGVVDSMDKCPNTPLNRNVDENGCELDGDKDGVVDALDQCLTTPMGDEVDAVGCSIIMLPADLGILFETNSAVIKSSDEEVFQQYVDYLNKVKDAKVVIEGHTDSVGDAKYNQILSEKRANSAKAKLVDMGIDAARIEAIGYGESKPLVPNDTKEHRAQNRRVIAKIVQ